MSRASRAGGVLAAAVLAMTGCAGPAETGDDALSVPVIVFAAASLKAPFDELADAFDANYREYTLAPIEYDGSAALASRVISRAEVDVIAFANEPSMGPVARAGLIDTSAIFASNTLQIAVAPGNAKKIQTLDDLADPDLDVVLCAPEVPCGAAAQELLDAAEVTLTPVSLETNVTSVATRVTLGEADAGLVYVTDVAASGGTLEGIALVNADVVVNRYPIAVVTGGPSTEAARAFVHFVQSSEGQAILAAHGFGPP